MDEGRLEQGGRQLESWKRVLILTHDRPDGDAIGAVGALKRILDAREQQAEGYLFQEAGPRYLFLAESCGLARWSADTAELESRFDGVVILDTCSWAQLEPAAAFLKTTTLPKIVVDHHPTRDDLKGKSAEIVELIDETAASVCGMVYDWSRRMNWTLDPAGREALFTGIATDTGWFRFPSVDGRTLKAAGELIDGGVRPDVMYTKLFEGHRPARLRLLREALDTMRLIDGGAFALMWLTRPMFMLCDAQPSDSEDLVNEPLAIGSVVVSVLLSEMEPGLIRANFRSRSPEIAGRDVDVSAIAKQFGGGGHRRAAGARIPGTLDDVREQVIAAVRAALGNG